MLSLILTLAILASGEGSTAADPGLCPEATTTVDMEECMKTELQRQSAELDKYFEEALRLLGDSSSAAKTLSKSQKLWLESRDAFASAISESYGPGTMAGVSYQGWQFGLTQRRIHDLWDAFIRTQVSSLPEPKE